MPSLEQLRLGKPYTQRELAEAAEVSENTIWLIEKHRHKSLRPRVMRAIAGALGVEPAEIAEFRASLGLEDPQGKARAA
jgi:transcriptional regulator with XRE-family HTH domain